MKLPLDIKPESDSIRNVSAKELHRLLLDKFRNARGSGRTIAPYYVWGAPGIGKTQIIRQFVNTCRSAGINANIIYVNGYGVQSRDDFGLHAHTTIKTTVNGQAVKCGRRVLQ